MCSTLDNMVLFPKVVGSKVGVLKWQSAAPGRYRKIRQNIFLSDAQPRKELPDGAAKVADVWVIQKDTTRATKFGFIKQWYIPTKASDVVR